MKEYPILMRGPQVRATLEDKKWQTRRIVKPPPPEHYRPFVTDDAADGCAMWAVAAGEIGNETSDVAVRRCPYGGAGSILWVRETWATVKTLDHLNPAACYQYDRPPAIYYAADNGAASRSPNRGKWRPSIFMPRWASRITLGVTQVRVERLCDITEEDAKAEGVEKEFRTVVMDPRGYKDYHIPNSYRGGFANLWEEIYEKKYPWTSSLWVWAITYRRVQL